MILSPSLSLLSPSSVVYINIVAVQVNFRPEGFELTTQESTFCLRFSSDSFTEIGNQECTNHECIIKR